MVAGGDYWDDRPVYSSGGGNYSKTGNSAMRVSKSLHKSCDPTRWKEELLTTDHKNPIFFALDVTGSMGNWSKIIYDKLPMFWGEIMMQKYLQDPALSFAGVGDAYSDQAPFQVTEFAQGKQIDQVLTKLWLEGFGGGNDHESYGLGAYFYLSRVDISKNEDAYLFLSGDEAFYPMIKSDHIKKVLGLEDHGDQDLDTRLVFEELKKKFNGNVFLLKKPYIDDDELERRALREWKEVMGDEHVLFFEKPKAIIDIILGVIAINSRTRTLERYIEDMKDRGQEEERIQLVNQVLMDLADWVEEKANKRRSPSRRENEGEVPDFEDEEDEDEVDEEEEEDDVFLGSTSRQPYYYDVKKLGYKK